MPRICILLLIVLATGILSSQNVFQESNDFFRRYVSNGLVNYSEVKISSLTGQLKESIAEYSLDGKSNDEQLAFYINAYNFHTINALAENYPVSSPMDIKGFFDVMTHNIAGTEMSLNDLENKFIRPTFNDARIHFALVCGALGCPPLVSFAYTAENVQSQLQTQSENAINNTQFIRTENGALNISKLFEWYSSDFGASTSEIIDFINSFRKEKIDVNSYGYYEYDWSINAQ